MVHFYAPGKISRVTEGIRTVEMENWYLYLYLLGHHYFSKDSPYVCSKILQKLYRTSQQCTGLSVHRYDYDIDSSVTPLDRKRVVSSTTK